jgi:hypothetical protein
MSYFLHWNYLLHKIYYKLHDLITENGYSYQNVNLIGIVGGGAQLGPLGTAVTNRPIVPAPGDYDDGEIGGI